MHNKCGDKPNGVYEKSPSHNKGNSVKSPAPIDGQSALNNSVSIGNNTQRRVGISNGQIVMLPQTTPGVYHGYVVTWTKLPQDARNALYEAGMVTLRGKIK